jgi:hypothetical protein
MPAGSLIDSNPIRGNDPATQFQRTYTTASGMRITYFHVYRRPIGLYFSAETRPLSRDARIEYQLFARAAQTEQAFDAESPQPCR